MSRVLGFCIIATGFFAACKKDAPPAAPAPRADERRVEAPRPAAEPARPAAPATGEVAKPVAPAAAAPLTGAARGSKAKGDGVKTCPVSGEEIGSGGMKPAELVYKGKKVRFCCKSCIKDFEKDPEAYLKD